jgi:hypothetical protein
MIDRRATISIPAAINIKQLYTVVIALLPAIAHFVVPFTSYGWATIVLGLFAPYAMFCFFKKPHITLAAFFIIVLIAYNIARSYTSGRAVFLQIIVLIHVLAAFSNSLDVRLFRKTLEVVAVFSAVIVIGQSILYYGLHIKSQLLIKSLLIPDNRYYVDKAVKAISFRPRAFFLEPSHYAQYCITGILSLLFPERDCTDRNNLKLAIISSIGIVLTRSGMGLVMCFGAFGWYALFSNKKDRSRLLKTIGLITLFILVIIILMQIPLVNGIVQRIIATDDSGYNAIDGRLIFWDRYIGHMTPDEMVYGLGKSIDTVTSDYMTGLMSTIYQFGVVGVVLNAIVILLLAFHGKHNVTICSGIVFVALFCFANVTGFIRMIFWLCLLVVIGEKEVRVNGNQ